MLAPISTLPQNDIVFSIEALRKIVDMGRAISFEIFRTNNLSARSAQGFLKGHDPKLTSVLCKVTISPTGYQIYWTSSGAKPSEWLNATKIYDDGQFDRGLAQLSHSENLLTLGSIQVH